MTSTLAPTALAGQTAFITGSSSGIGLGIARRFAELGATVVLNSTGDRAKVAPVLDELIAAFGERIDYVQADLSRPASTAAAVEQLIARHGGIDLLINNAGIQHVAPVDEFPLEKWDQIIALNLSAAFHTVRLALPGMKRRGFGRIVNVASAHALVASPFKSAYVAAKHGIAGFTKSVALEVAEQNITVNAVCPGYVLTPLVQKQIPDTAKARGITEEAVIRDVLLAAQPTKKFVTVEEVAALTAFLCTTEAASITGAILPVEGGWLAH